MSDTFGALWDRLEAELRARVGNPKLYGKQLIDSACTDPALAPHLAELTDLVKLRNLVVHNQHLPLVEPTAAALNVVQTILDLVQMTAGDIAASPVFTVTEDAAAEAVASTMEANVYTAVPVVGEGRIIGVFSEATALRLMAHRSRLEAPSPVRIGDLSDLLDQPNQSDNFAHYRCALAATPATEVFKWFGESTAAGVRLNAVFLTESGDSDTPPTAVVTAWDLRRVGRAATRSEP